MSGGGAAHDYARRRKCAPAHPQIDRLEAWLREEAGGGQGQAVLAAAEEARDDEAQKSDKEEAAEQEEKEQAALQEEEEQQEEEEPQHEQQHHEKHDDGSPGHEMGRGWEGVGKVDEPREAIDDWAGFFPLLNLFTY
eukprot:SAG11_NODE_5304_length_1601_cov_2.151798_1_plen_137_part_00